MFIISPTFQNGHKYSEYEAKIKEVRAAFLRDDVICLDMDFLHENELHKYIRDILLSNANKEFRIRSKSVIRLKEILTILDSYMILCSDIAYGIKYFYATIHN